MIPIITRCSRCWVTGRSVIISKKGGDCLRLGVPYGEMGLDKNRLYATVFEGSKDDHLEEDKEALEYWKLYLPEDRILYGNKKDNFWEMGDMGPCGPCSEIHIDLRPEAERVLKPGRELVNKDNPLVIEIWNLVFMQYNRKADGSLEEFAQSSRGHGDGIRAFVYGRTGKDVQL